MPGSLPRTTWHSLARLLNPTDGQVVGEATPSDGDWVAIYQLATAHWVAPALFAALVTRGQSDHIPGDVYGALEALWHLNDQRNRHLRQVLRGAVQALNEADIAPVLLKGALALLPGQYPHAFARMLSDLDLAVTEAELTPASKALRAAGFDYAPNTAPIHPVTLHGHHHLPPLFHPSGDGYVEIHRALLSNRVPESALSLAMVQTHAQHLDWDGLQVRIPALEHRLLHNALHHQLQDQAFYSDRLSLRQMLEFCQLRSLPAAAAIDWPSLMVRLDHAGAGDAVRGYLLAVQTLFGQPLPAGIQPTSAALRAERRFALRLDQTRRGQLLELRWQLLSFARRLQNLPRHLVTPAWYPAKYRSLRNHWCPAPAAPPEEFPN